LFLTEIFKKSDKHKSRRIGKLLVYVPLGPFKAKRVKTEVSENRKTLSICPSLGN
jgi:hypothetical protein